MYGRKQTLYDILEITRDAKQTDVVRAWRRIHGEMQKETAAPNPRRAALVHEAYEVLSDPQKREAYDRSLRGPTFFGVEVGEKPARRWGLVGGAIALVLGALWYFTLGSAPAPHDRAEARNPQEVQAAAAVAVGRVNRVDLSGARAVLGAAVAVEEGVMMAPCAGIAPGAVLVVRIPPRDIPATLRHADEGVGLCRLAVSGGASWPLAMTGLVPRAGDTVYLTSFDARGDVVVSAAQVKKVSRGDVGSVIEASPPAAPPAEGAPLLDHEGRVVAIARNGRYTTLPASWIVDVPVRKRAPAPTPEPAAADPPAATPETSPGDIDPRLRDVPPEKVERLQKAFRPPPKVPDDI